MMVFSESAPPRAALADFVALGPDFLWPAGGTPADTDDARTVAFFKRTLA